MFCTGWDRSLLPSASRLEYTAVGPAVNLASRLCELALDGEVLIDNQTIEDCADCRGKQGLESRQPVPVKGYADPVPLFNLLDVALA